MALDKDVLERLGLYAQLVFDETKASANTHTRVGQAFIDTHTLFEEVEKDEADIAQLQKDLKTTQDDLSDLDKREKEDIDAVNDSISELAKQEKDDIDSVNEALKENIDSVNKTIAALAKQESDDIEAVNEKIAAILPRLILPLYGIMPDEVTIKTAGILADGVAVWCSANGAFAWQAKNGSFFTTDFYGTWGAYGIYPDGNTYHSELSEGANTEVWYYVQAEGAFYYWNGSAMEKITVIEFATQSDLAKKQDILKAGEGITIEDNTISADLTNIVPTEMSLDYPSVINIDSEESYEIGVTLLPEGVRRNVLFFCKGDSLQVGVGGKITLLQGGVTTIWVVPTCNTSLAQEISIDVNDKALRMVTASSMRFASDGTMRLRKISLT